MTGLKSAVGPQADMDWIEILQHSSLLPHPYAILWSRQSPGSNGVDRPEALDGTAARRRYSRIYCAHMGGGRLHCDSTRDGESRSSGRRMGPSTLVVVNGQRLLFDAGRGATIRFVADGRADWFVGCDPF
jgi:hypothetical protein